MVPVAQALEQQLSEIAHGCRAEVAAAALQRAAFPSQLPPYLADLCGLQTERAEAELEALIQGCAPPPCARACVSLACRLRVACVRFSAPRGWHWSGLRLQSDGRARAEFLDRPPAVDKILEADAAGECSEPPPRCPCSVPHPRSAADSHSAPRDCLGQHRRFQSPCRVSGQCVDAKGRPASTHPCIRACRPHRTRPSHRTAPHPIPPPMPPPHSSFPRPFGARRQPP
jgi:hypothetical protein